MSPAARPTLRFIVSVRAKGAETVERARLFHREHLAAFGDRVEMHVDHPRFHELLDAQDAMIFPAEDLYAKVDAPLVVLETMARGKPVFLLDRPPLTEIPGPDIVDALVARDDAEMIAKIQTYVDDPSSISSEALRRAIRDRFSPQYAADAVLRSYSR